MTKNSAPQGKPYAPQRILHSSSGNAHFGDTDFASPPSPTPIGSSIILNQRKSPVTRSIIPLLDQQKLSAGHASLTHHAIRDKRGKVFHIWKKVTADGVASGPQDQILTFAGGYLEPCVKEDEHGRKHYGYWRSGQLTDAELQSEKYLKYRHRSRRDVDENGEEKWSERLERAFQLTIRLIPPMGKKKLNDRRNESKSRGRNELISDKIFELTGIRRCRKQISSHIQVLRNLMPQGHPWLTLVTFDGKANADVRSGYQSHAEPKYENPSNYLKTQPHPLGVKREEDSDIPMLTRPDGLLGRCDPSQYPSVQHIELGMYIYAAAKTDIIHTYTTMQSETGAQPRNLEDVLDWRSIYPDLAKLYHDHGQLNSEIFLVEANFKLMDDLPPGKSRLGTHLSAAVACNASYVEWYHTTKFYEKGEFKLQCSESLKSDIATKFRGLDLEIPFKSTWWRDVFQNITIRRHKMMATGNIHELQQEDEDARRYLREMTVMQEIFGKSLHDREPRRVAILLWKFRQTRGHETGTTTWRRLHGLTVTSPMPVISQPPLKLESTIHDSRNDVDKFSATQLKISTWESTERPKPSYVNEPIRMASGNTYNIMDDLNGTSDAVTHSKRNDAISNTTRKESSHSVCGYLKCSPENGLISNSDSKYDLDMEKEDYSNSGYSPNAKYNELSLEHEARPMTVLSTPLQSDGTSSGPSTFFASICMDRQDENFDAQDIANLCDTYDFASQENPGMCTAAEGESQGSTACASTETADQDNTGSHSHDFTGGQIHLSFDAAPDLSVYDPALLASTADMDSHYQHQSYHLPECGQEQTYEQDQPFKEYDSNHPSYFSPDHTQEHQIYQSSDQHQSDLIPTQYHQTYPEHLEQYLDGNGSQDSQQTHSGGFHWGSSSWDSLGISPDQFLGVADTFEQAGLSLTEGGALHSWGIVNFQEELKNGGRQVDRQGGEREGQILGEILAGDEGMNELERSNEGTDKEEGMVMVEMDEGVAV